MSQIQETILDAFKTQKPIHNLNSTKCLAGKLWLTLFLRALFSTTFCVWGGGIGCPSPSLKSALIELEKFQRQFWKALKNHGEYLIYILKM